MRITVDTTILVRTNAKATGPAKEPARYYPAMWRDSEVRHHIEYLQSFAEIVIPAEGPPVVIKDPDDDPVIYTAVAGGADVICTVDRHFYEPNVLAFCSRQGIHLITETELLYTLRGQ